MKNAIIKSKDISNEAYHGMEGVYSSSQLKDALLDVEIFYKKYITKELKSESIPAFDIGTYFHTALLEPENLDKDCVVWMGARRSGKEWEKFQAENSGKAIITQNELQQAVNLIDAVKASPVASGLLSKGESEVSFLNADFKGVPVRVRCDKVYLSKDESYIIDLKSTTGNCKDRFSISNKIESYSYDLSAALYVDVVNDLITKMKLDVAPVSGFYWIFASKDMCNSRTYLASANHLKVGRAKYNHALAQIKKYQALGWKFPDEVEEVQPPKWSEDFWLASDSTENKGSKFNNKKNLSTNVLDLV